METSRVSRINSVHMLLMNIFTYFDEVLIGIGHGYNIYKTSHEDELFESVLMGTDFWFEEAAGIPPKSAVECEKRARDAMNLAKLLKRSEDSYLEIAGENLKEGDLPPEEVVENIRAFLAEACVRFGWFAQDMVDLAKKMRKESEQSDA